MIASSRRYLSAIFAACLLVSSSVATPITFDPSNELGVFIDYDATKLNSFANVLDNTIPNVIKKASLGKEQKSQFYTFGYGGSTTNFSIFATYPSKDGNQWDVSDKIESEIKSSAPQLVQGNPSVTGVKIIVSKLNQTDTAEMTLGFRGVFTALPGKTEDVKQFLLDLNPVIEAEPFSPVWLVMQIYDKNGPTSSFEAINFFQTAEDQQAHLDGQVPVAFNNISHTLLVAPSTRVPLYLSYYEA